MDLPSKSGGSIASLSRRRDGSVDVATTVHPPRYRWLTRIAIPGGILLGILVLFFMVSAGSLVPATQVTASPVIERPAEGQRSGTAAIQAAGWIEAFPYLVHATALTDGVVEEVLVLEGDAVEVGQVLARLVSDDARMAHARAQAEVGARRADLADAEARLAAATSDWENPVESQRAVSVAEARLNESRALLAQTESEILAGEADEERLRSEHERIASLGESQTASRGEVINARTRMKAQQANVEALRQKVEVVRAQIAREEAEKIAASENLRLRTVERLALGSAVAAVARAEADLERSRAELSEADLRMERLDVKSPVSGVVVERFKQPGSKVMLGMDDPTSSTIVTLYDPAKLQVRVDVPLADAGAVMVGQPVEVSVDALPNQRFNGAVTRILHRADIQKNTLQIKATIVEPSALLRPEMLARVRFMAVQVASVGDSSGSAGTTRTALYAPRRAVSDDVAWVVEEYNGVHGVAQRRVLTMSGTERDGWLEVAAGLNAGDLLVVSPSANLKAGARLRVTLSQDEGN